MQETQESISKWATETFGVASSNARVAARANEELAELILEMADWPAMDKKIADELADVTIVLCRLASRMDFTLRVEILPGDFALSVNYNDSDARTVGKANAHMARLLRALTADDDSRDAPEHANAVMTMLLQLAAFLDIDLMSEVDKKMLINRSRVWNLDGSGHGYHVRDKATA